LVIQAFEAERGLASLSGVSGRHSHTEPKHDRGEENAETTEWGVAKRGGAKLP